MNAVARAGRGVLNTWYAARPERRWQLAALTVPPAESGAGARAGANDVGVLMLRPASATMSRSECDDAREPRRRAGTVGTVLVIESFISIGERV